MWLSVIIVHPANAHIFSPSSDEKGDFFWSFFEMRGEWNMRMMVRMLHFNRDLLVSKSSVFHFLAFIFEVMYVICYVIPVVVYIFLNCSFAATIIWEIGKNALWKSDIKINGFYCFWVEGDLPLVGPRVEWRALIRNESFLLYNKTHTWRKRNFLFLI